MPTTTKEKETVTVSSFGIEADHPRNCDLLLRSVTNCRLRSRLFAGRTVEEIDPATNETISMIPPDQAAGLSRYPELPGMQLHIDTKTGEVTIFDPLTKKLDLCARLEAVAKEKGVYNRKTKVRGVPTRKEKTNKHQLKTLIREVLELLDAGHVKMVKGVKPDTADVNAMSGRYLHDPGTRVPNMHPRFEDQWESYYEQQQNNGG